MLAAYLFPLGVMALQGAVFIGLVYIGARLAIRHERRSLR